MSRMSRVIWSARGFRIVENGNGVCTVEEDRADAMGEQSWHNIEDIALSAWMVELLRWVEGRGAVKRGGTQL